MREIYILRHAEKDASGELTDEGKIRATEFQGRIGHFDFVYSSPQTRAVETAKLLAGKDPIIDIRADAIPLTSEELADLHEKGKHHQFGIAGVLFESDVYRPKIMERGEELVRLIEATFDALSDDGRVLIVSHDGVMVAAEMIIRNMESAKAYKTFKPLEGFRVFDNWSVEDVN